tara:strand:+ start:54 stop:536 length:483 start_codon:yes stop_codon:yes gene_type:complete
MHKKKIDNSLTKKFIQGLRPLSSTLPAKIKKVLKKNGFNLSSIVDNWTNIVGSDISDKCYPINIKAQGKSKEVTLILNVIHGKEVDIEYNRKNIIDKVNSYFGYIFINKIHIKIINIKLNNQMKTENKIKNDFNSDLKKVQNINLRNNLKKLIIAYNEKK